MYDVYDNGEKVLGRIYNVKEYLCKNSYDATDVKDIIEDLENYDEDTIVAIDYSFGMGYRIEYWKKNDVVKEGE